MVSRPSPGVPDTVGADSASAGCVNPSRSPGTRPWVANTMMRNFERLAFFTVSSLAAMPRLSTLAGSAWSASAIEVSSAAVSGRRGSSASSAFSTLRVCGEARRTSGNPRVVASASWMPACGPVSGFWRPRPAAG